MTAAGSTAHGRAPPGGVPVLDPHAQGREKPGARRAVPGSEDKKTPALWAAYLKREESEVKESGLQISEPLRRKVLT